MNGMAGKLAGCGLVILSMLCAGDVVAQRGPGGGGPPRGGQGFQPRAAPLHAGAVMREYRFEPTGEKMKYALFVPRKLDKGKPAPLVIALHGAGGGPESILNALAAAADKHRYILVAPTGYSATGWYGFVRRIAGPAERETSRLSEIDVMNVLGLVRAEYNIDPRRIYVVGASMGGVGAVHLAVKYPGLWAAIGVISPAITSNVPEEFVDYAGAPVVVLHGDRDEGVDVGLVRGWVVRLNERKIPLRYYEYKGGTHISVVQQAGENVFSFLDQHSRAEAAAAP
jgi:predicted peptidase